MRKDSIKAPRLTHCNTKTSSETVLDGSSKTCHSVIFEPKQSATSEFGKEKFPMWEGINRTSKMFFLNM